MSPMSVWLPARLRGTKDHREFSTQRGTDTSFTPTSHSSKSLVCNTLSGQQCQLAQFFWATKANWTRGRIVFSALIQADFFFFISKSNTFNVAIFFKRSFVVFVFLRDQPITDHPKLRKSASISTPADQSVHP